jgi:hypothetical protein
MQMRGAPIVEVSRIWKSLLGSLLAGALLLPGSSAMATSFSFGSIAPTDIIDNMVIGAAGPTLDYDSTTGKLLLESFITTINFHNRAPLSIPSGTVTIRSEVQLVGTPTFLPFAPVLVTSLIANFTNGLVDYQVIDTLGTGSGMILMMEGDFSGNAVLSAQIVTGVIVGSYGGNLLTPSLSGDADFLSAFGTTGGSFSVNPAYGLPSGGSLCGAIVTCGPPTVISTFDKAANGKIQSNNPIPEPGTAVLVATGLIALAMRRRQI